MGHWQVYYTGWTSQFLGTFWTQISILMSF